MADPEPSTGASPHRRDRRRERSRERVKRIAAGIGIAVLVVAVVLIATDAVRLGGDRPSLAGTVDTIGRDDAAPASTTSTTTPRDCRPLSTEDPLRLWVGGDSLAGSLGPSLGAMAGATGVVQPYFDSRVSSGLADPSFFDWPDHATTELASINPEVVVFIVGANDWAAVDDDWKAAYTTQVDTMMNTLVAPGRTVYWLGSPTLKDATMDAAVAQVNAVAQEVAKHHPEVHYVDTYKLFSDTDGMFAYDLPDETGEVTTMRSGDGVHFSMEGADYLARSMYKLVDAQCGVTEQKVDGAAKAVIQAEGSTQVAPSSESSGSSSGYSSGSSSGSGSSGGAVQTTPPAPATTPVATNPPTTTPAPAPAPATTTAPAPPAQDEQASSSE